MADHAELIARLEAATGPDRELDADICKALGGQLSGGLWKRPGETAYYGTPAEVTASIDAALALAQRAGVRWEEVLSEALKMLGMKHGWRWHMNLSRPEQLAELPIAILIALIRALEKDKP